MTRSPAAHALTKLDAVAFADEELHEISTISESSINEHDVVTDNQPLRIKVSLRYRVTAILTLAIVGVIVLLITTFRQGHELRRFQSTEYNATQQSKLLDDYNSYSANVASVFGKPIELFVSLTVQVITLRCLASYLLRPQTSWKAGVFALALGGGVQYLINNGFNSLNVQLKSMGITARMAASDLAVETNAAATTLAELFTSINNSVAEASPKNLLINTVLRNVVLPSKQAVVDHCDWEHTLELGSGRVSDTFVRYGFPQRDWHAKLLQEAKQPKTLRVDMNDSSASITSDGLLPMNASLAADLFIYGMVNTPFLLQKWSKDPVWVDESYVEAAYSEDDSTSDSKKTRRVAKVTGLLPPSTVAGDELYREQWFLRESTASLMRYVEQIGDTSQENVAMEFSHVDITDTVQFDSVTFEVEINPDLMATHEDAETADLYTVINQEQACGPWPATCMIKKAELDGQVFYDAPPQVKALAMCADEHGNEALLAASTLDEALAVGLGIQCPKKTDSSMLIISLAKTLSADELIQNQTINADGMVTDSTTDAMLVNARRRFSITVGRLAWQIHTLSSVFNAQCDDDVGGCDGLAVPLEAALGTETNRANNATQWLVVGKSALPLDMLMPARGFATRPRYFSLVRVDEPANTPGAKTSYAHVAGDPLLQHSIKKLTWDMSQPPPDPLRCDAHLEARYRTMLDNHLYMEHSLQSAYTAAVFFLFQNGAVKDEIKLGNGGTSLALNTNYEELAVWISIPHQNARLTIVGCMLLVAGVLIMVVWSLWLGGHESADPLKSIDSPAVITRVLVDESQFPPLLLRRRVVMDTLAKAGTRQTISQYEVESVGLVHRTESTRRVAKSKKTPALAA